MFLYIGKSSFTSQRSSSATSTWIVPEYSKSASIIHCTRATSQGMATRAPWENTYLSSLRPSSMDFSCNRHSYSSYCLLAGFTFVLFFKAGKQKFLPKLKGTFYILHDMKWAFYNLFFSSFVVSLIRLAQPRYGFIYYNISDYGWPYLFLSILLHLIWDETLTYSLHLPY